MAPRVLEILTWLAVNAGLIILIATAAFVGHFLVFRILLRLCARTQSPFDELLVSRCQSPTRWIVIGAAFWFALDMTTIPAGVTTALRRLDSVVVMVLTVWLLIRILRVGCRAFLNRYSVSVADNLQARAMHTQVRVLERVITAVIIVVGFGCILMTFDGVRQLGVSLLASAGIAGIILGLAAQRALGTLLAGLQLAITQPIRIEDVVIVEGEWGVVEEITLTYVVVRIWDLRRLVVPITYFMEKPFQNWTRKSADILGTVFLQADFSTNVSRVREELHRLLGESPEWDGKVWGLQVTGTGDRGIELRALMGARNAGDAWNLRCRIREGLLDFMNSRQPGAIPKARVLAMEVRPPTLSNLGV